MAPVEGWHANLWSIPHLSDIYTALYIKQVTNKNLLYSTGNSTQYFVTAYLGKESNKNKEWMWHMCNWITVLYTWSQHNIINQLYCQQSHATGDFWFEWHSSRVKKAGGSVVKTSPAVRVQSLIRELRSHIPHASWPKKRNLKQKQYCNKLNKGFKNDPHQNKIKERWLKRQ